MKKLNEYSGVLAIVAVLIAIIVPFFLQGSLSFGATGTRFPNGLSTDSTSPSAGELRTTILTTTSGDVTIGTNGDAATRVNHGFCNVDAASKTITATSTQTVDCGGGSLGGTALTGITAGDVCFLSMSTTSPTTANGLNISGASASSTSGFITANVTNITGGDFTWTAAASTSLPYLCIDS